MNSGFYGCDKIQLRWQYFAYILKAHARNIHTSPACLTVERVVQNFRARSQLLVAQLEDTDEVLQKTFPGDSPTVELISSDSSTPLNMKPKELDDADNQDVDRYIYFWNVWFLMLLGR